MKKITLFLGGMLCLLACRQSSRSEVPHACAIETDMAMSSGLHANFADPSRSREERQADESIPSGPSSPAPEMIIRHANLEIHVDNYARSRSDIGAMLGEHKAFLTSEHEEHSRGNRSNQMLIRVRHGDFDALVNGLSALAKQVDNKSITAEDVTAQYVDIQTRMKSKKEVETQYLALLKQARNVSDMLEIEEKLRVIREEIEAKEGALKLMKDRVTYSTIELRVSETVDTPAETRPGFLLLSKMSLGMGWDSFLSFLLNILAAWPVWVSSLLGGTLIYRLIRKRIRKTKASAPVTNGR